MPPRHAPTVSHVVTLPRPVRLAAHIASQVGEAVVLPLVVFYSLLVSTGLTWALAGALLWGSRWSSSTACW